MHKASRDCRQEIADWVSALDNSRQDASPTRRGTFHGQGRTDSPFPTHPNTVDGTQDQEYGVIGGKPAEQLKDREEDHVGHERPAPSIAISQKSKHKGAQGPHRKRGGDRENDLGGRYVKLCRQGIDKEEQDKEVKNIQRPPQENGDDGVPIIRAG